MTGDGQADADPGSSTVLSLTEPHASVEVLTTHDQLLGLRAEWLELETASGTDLPFQTWEWAVAWWAHLREHSRGVRDHLRVCVVRDEAGRTLAIAPLILTERPSVGPVRVRMLQFMGADPNITEIRTMLCRRGFEDICSSAIREHFVARPTEWDWLSWQGPAKSISVAPPSLESLNTEERSTFVLELPRDWQAMKGHLGRNIKESLRKCYNSLRRDGLSAALEIVDDAREIEAGLADFFRLHAARARMEGAPRHADVFASQEARSFLINVCRMLADRKIARIFRLRVDGKIVAIRLGFQLGDSLYLYYSGWDGAFGPYSVMTTLLAEILQHAIADGLASVNLSTGKDVSKTRWGPTEVSYSGYVELSPRVTANVRFRGYNAMRSLGAGRLTRELLPGFLVRRSEPRRPIEPFRGLFRHMPTRMHALAGTFIAIAVMDLLDNTLDHQWHMLPADIGRYLP